ncbi:MAG: glycosyltransferase family 9 protein [Lentisphaerae bacterium]|nr:glycosyltransferase family 9 protein [Lentisphaerota bacterium]
MGDIKNFRNGLVVRMPDDFTGVTEALPVLTALKKIIPEYCGLFIAVPGRFNQLIRALPIVDAVIPLEKKRAWWSKEEFRMLRQLHAGAVVMLKKSVMECFLFKAAGIPQIFAFPGSYDAAVSGAGAAVENMRLPQVVLPCRADELTGGVVGLFNHPRLMTVIPGADGNILPEHISMMKKWIDNKGIVVICGMNQVAGSIWAQCRKKFRNSCFNFCRNLDIFAQMYTMRFSSEILTDDPGYLKLAELIEPLRQR